MPGEMQHSPARVIAELLISAGYGVDGQGVLPDASNVWPIYVAREPDRPDQIIKVLNTVGISFGTTQPDSEFQEHQGIQILVRAENEEEGYYKANRIAVFLDQIARSLVDIAEIESVGTGTINYIIHAITRTSNVMHIGSDTPQGKRQLFTINATVAIRICCD